MPKKYLQLTSKDRLAIDHWGRRGWSMSAIAEKIGVHKSTISRELKRNARRLSREEELFSLEMRYFWDKKEYAAQLKKLDQNPRFEWNATDAQRFRRVRVHLANQLRTRKKPETAKWVVQKLKKHWSPEQIAGRSPIEGPEQVSHEYVYRLILQNRKAGGTLHHLLKRFGKRKQRLNRRIYPSGPIIPNRRPIEQRPKIVAARSRLGDLEGDLIQGYRSSGYILSVVDRQSRFVVLRKLPYKRKKLVRIQLQRAIKKMKHSHTLTVDNGSEFCDHEELTRRTQVPVYFAHPYCSTDKGLIENTNALVRYFLPKRTCFKNLTQTRLNELQKILNSRPRKCLDYLTPEEFHFKNQPDLPKIKVALLI